MKMNSVDSFIQNLIVDLVLHLWNYELFLFFINSRMCIFQKMGWIFLSLYLCHSLLIWLSLRIIDLLSLLWCQVCDLKYSERMFQGVCWFEMHFASWKASKFSLNLGMTALDPDKYLLSNVLLRLCFDSVFAPPECLS